MDVRKLGVRLVTSKDVKAQGAKRDAVHPQILSSFED
jgi:hypothetical protein